VTTGEMTLSSASIDRYNTNEFSFNYDTNREITLQQEHFDLDSSLYHPPLPPLPSLVTIRQRTSSAHSRSIVQSSIEQQPTPKLIFSVIPYWNKWQLDITFNRTLLEEFMDR